MPRRKTWKPLWTAAWLLFPLALRAQLQFQPDQSPQTFFAGGSRRIRAIFHNPEDRPVSARLRVQLCQASSAIVMPLSPPRDWKKLDLLPGQTVLESIPLPLPSVRTATRFLLLWLDDHNQTLGRSDIMAYPTNLLRALEPLAAGKPLGIFDPQNQLKPLVTALAIEFSDLETVGFTNFSGKLAFVGPFSGDAEASKSIADQVVVLAKAGRAVVWLPTSSPPRLEFDSIAYAARVGAGAIVLAPADSTVDLPDNPRAQLDLINMARLALNPDLLNLHSIPP